MHTPIRIKDTMALSQTYRSSPGPFSTFRWPFVSSFPHRTLVAFYRLAASGAPFPIGRIGLCRIFVGEGRGVRPKGSNPAGGLLVRGSFFLYSQKMGNRLLKGNKTQ